MDVNQKFAETISEMENTRSLVPVTPDIGGEGRDRYPHSAFDSPLSLGCKLRERFCLDYTTDRSGGCRFHTPKGEIFYSSSATDLDNLLMTKKDPDERRTSASRSLNFGGPCTKIHETKVVQGNDIVLSDEQMVESFYENRLGMIFSSNKGDAVSVMANLEFDDDGCKTPTSGLRLTGIAETCPGAPMKAAVKTRKINRGSSLCRQLEF